MKSIQPKFEYWLPVNEMYNQVMYILWSFKLTGYIKHLIVGVHCKPYPEHQELMSTLTVLLLVFSFNIHSFFILLANLLYHLKTKARLMEHLGWHHQHQFVCFIVFGLNLQSLITAWFSMQFGDEVTYVINSNTCVIHMLFTWVHHLEMT